MLGRRVWSQSAQQTAPGPARVETVITARAEDHFLAIEIGLFARHLRQVATASDCQSKRFIKLNAALPSRYTADGRPSCSSIEFRAGLKPAALVKWARRDSSRALGCQHSTGRFAGV